MPEGAVYVGRPTKWGNPFKVAPKSMFNAEMVVYLYRELATHPEKQGPAFKEVMRNLSELCGKDLACWCPLDQPCHADVLLELANK